ncbi:YsnF/AvaK domain-containing protein [Rhizorhabdus argentea]|uniref:YsnF/AvaK domain-containing protein n=1 Tax=Rhizorhabdus argentea TaxID=1387174 RepID=UPI0030EBC49F
MANRDRVEVIPLVEEQISTSKERFETGTVRVRTFTTETIERVTEELRQDQVDIHHVPVDRPIESVPDIREEDGTLIIPVVEEILVVEKRLVLKEEIHIRRRQTAERFEKSIPLKSQQAIIERHRSDGTVSPPSKE